MIMKRREFCGALLFAASAVTGLLISGCGGTSNGPSGTSPTRATKTKLQQIHSLNVRSLSQNGSQNATVASRLNGVSPAIGASGSGGGLASGNISNNGGHSAPLIGAFINNVAAVPRGRAAKTRHTRGDSTLYFDDYLGLWVEFTETPSTTSYLLYIDENKTQPAGSIITLIPGPNDNPQVYSSTYEYTSGSQKGAHGSYKTTSTAEGSGSSTYDDIWADGSKDNGSSAWTAAGDYKWTGHYEFNGTFKTNSSGTFHSDGSGLTHSDSSDGYIWDFNYRSDGSGNGHVMGPDPGLPASIVWDNMGNTTITYADGSTEHYNSWFYVDDGGVASGGSGDASGGVTSSGVNTSNNAGAKP